jgi:HTH-type transcriptional regulator / antitoxin HigA
MKAIRKESEYHAVLSKVEKLIEKGFENLSQEETSQLAMLSESVESYEIQRFPMPIRLSVVSLLENVMHEKKMNKSEFSKLLEIPNSTLSDILNGKRKININIAKKLHDKLLIDGNSILESE